MRFSRGFARVATELDSSWRDDPSMDDRMKVPSTRLASLALGLGLALAPTLARAAPPDQAPHFETSEVLRVAEGPADAEVAIDEPSGTLELPSLEPEPPGMTELPSLTPDALAPTPDVDGTVAAPTSTSLEPRVVEGRRTKTGAGLMTFGALGMAASSMLALSALSGPGWLGLDRQQAVLMGALAVPVGALSAGVLAAGARSAKRYGKWAERNQLNPPKSGNGMLVAGALITGGMLGLAAYTTQRNLIDSSPERGAWASTAVAGGASLVGAVVFVAGGIRRSKFAAWQSSAHLMPGTMALRGGSGLTLSGRF